MTRIAGALLLLVGSTVCLVLIAGVGYVFPIASGKLFILWVVLLVNAALVTVAAVAGTAHRLYHLGRGRRDKDAGTPCVQCGRTAFPVENTTTRYRCWNCGSRFDGPEHF